MSLPLPLSDSKTCVIAEISANHNQSLERAISLVKAAAESGADAIKIQTYTADTLTLKSDREEFKITQDSLWKGRTLHDLYQEAHTPWAWHAAMKSEAESHGVPFFSSPFDLSSVEFLEDLDVPAYKIASPEIIDKHLIEACAETQKPLIISTGMASLSEIEDAITWAKSKGNENITLLKCTSAYPAKAEEMNLKAITLMQKKFNVRVGLSDHTLGDTAAIASVSLGARVVEKHFTLSRSDGGPDAAFSMEPEEFKVMVQRIRMTESALGDGVWSMSQREAENLTFRRSLYWTSDLKAGDIISEENVKSVRPSLGIPPKHLDSMLGKPTKKAVQKHCPVSFEDF